MAREEKHRCRHTKQRWVAKGLRQAEFCQTDAQDDLWLPDHLPGMGMKKSILCRNDLRVPSHLCVRFLPFWECVER